jgi:trk system potassium uptake protein TrkA
MRYIVIIGCGNLGSSLANRLSRQGHSVVVVDRREESFSSLGDEFSGFMIRGDANEFFVLSQAKVEKADLVLSVTDDDNLNIMLSLISLKLYNIPQVIARVNQPRRADIFNRLGISTICPVDLAVESLLNSLDGKDGA